MDIICAVVYLTTFMIRKDALDSEKLDKNYNRNEWTLIKKVNDIVLCSGQCV